MTKMTKKSGAKGRGVSERFCQLLAKRGLNINTLAAQTQTGRCHLSQVLSNKPGRGLHTRIKLYHALTYAEIEELGWHIEYNRWLIAESVKREKKDAGAISRLTSNRV